MKPLTLSVKQIPDQRVDMSPLVAQQLSGKKTVDIGKITLQCGKNLVRVDALFNLSGDDTSNIVIKNSHNKLDFIGKDMDAGKISVEGDTGAYLALGMKSGEIHVSGNCGIFAACEMRGGLLAITGNAGDFVGSALPGNKKGMNGGTVVIKGNAGDRAGDRMRRGYLLIEGNAGDYCGSRMIAGTIAVMGKTGQHIGYNMRRGTLLLWEQPKLPPTFNDCGTHSLAILPILFASFRQLDSKFARPDTAFNRVHRYGGDIAELARGEILVKNPD
ncbi:MAG: formylmethanofuran dehydrogenase subunit C [Gammaproteobacteria bacterium]|nr:formylmethanofuran dehydrogenase subunit C [Gammaproteobacteria bacterium]